MKYTGNYFIAAARIVMMMAAMCVGLAPELSSAGTRRVPADHATIQSALDAAETGDEIIASPGQYFENLIFPGVDVILRSDDPTSMGVVSATIIDGQKAGSVVTFAGTETTGTLLAGFTITNGQAPSGGGIAGNGSLATIANNVISSNTAVALNSSTGLGGGLARCDGLITDNIIAANAADFVGGGLYFCTGSIVRNVITRNRCAGGGNGAGIYLAGGRVAFNQISHNDATDGLAANADGGGVMDAGGIIEYNIITSNKARHGGGLRNCHGVVRNNIITHNIALTNGGGIHNSAGVLQNNLIAQNTAGNSGGGVYGSNAQFINNTIAHNAAGASGGGISNGNIYIANSIVWGNAAPTASQMELTRVPVSISNCVQDGSGPGVIADDPLFANAAGGDFRLTADSPCLDTGNYNRMTGLEWRDLDNNCRLAGSQVDMGCYEWGAGPDSDGDLLADDAETSAGTLVDVGDTDGDGLPDGVEFLRGTLIFSRATAAPPGLHIPDGYPTIQDGLFFAVPGETVTVAPGEYAEWTHFLGKDVILQSAAPHDRDNVTSTILTTPGWGPVLMFQGVETPSAALRGFTLEGGDWNQGGGIDGNNTRATIEWCVIRGNTAASGGGVADCDGLFQQCEFTNNLATSTFSGGGAAFSCNGVFSRCLMKNNTSMSLGGAAQGDARIEDCVIRGNAAAMSGGGLMSPEGGVYRSLIENNAAGENGGGVFGGGPFEECVVRGNSAGENGAGLHIPDVSVTECLIVDNSGTGIYNNQGFTAYSNNIFSGNSMGGLFPGRNCAVTNNIFYGNTLWGLHRFQNNTVTNNILWNNDEPLGGLPPSGFTFTYNCIQGGAAGLGNIAGNPLLADPANGDYSLLPGSPCIDAGSPGLSDACQPPGQGLARSDMGALGGPMNCAMMGSAARSIAKAIIGAGGSNSAGRVHADINNDLSIDAADVVLALRLTNFDAIPAWE